MKLVAYYRVSTKRQGESGWGLDAQRAAVEAHAARTGGKIVAEFVEVESGRNNEREKLRDAISRTRAVRGTLVIAKLDRLARNVAFVSALMDSGVEFVCGDNPNATRLTMHILAAVAEDEARRISERTKAALAQARGRDVKLGTHRPGHVIDHAKGTRNGLKKAVAAAAAVRLKARQDCYKDLKDKVLGMRDDGDSFAEIADALNQEGRITTGGKEFQAMTVKRLVDAWEG